MRTRAIPERLGGVITTRHYTNPLSPYLYVTLHAYRILDLCTEEQRSRMTAGVSCDTIAG